MRGPAPASGEVVPSPAFGAEDTDMTRRREQPAPPPEAPRTDLPPTREPYDDGYFGTGEEEGVVREREAPAKKDEPDEHGRR